MKQGNGLFGRLIPGNKWIRQLQADAGCSHEEAERLLAAARERGIPEETYVRDGYWYVPEEELETAWEEREMRQKQADLLLKKGDSPSEHLIRDMIIAEYTRGIRPSNFRKYRWDLISEEDRETLLVPNHTLELSEKYDRPDVNIGMLTDKGLFYSAFDEMIGRKWFLFREDHPGRDWCLEQLQRLTSEHLILKPALGHRGKEISRVPNPRSPQEAEALYESLSKQVMEVTTEAAAGTELEDEPRAILVEECLTQHPAMAMLNDSSINTIRTVVLCTDEIQQVLYAACRMGMPGSITDNVGRGGKTAAVDPRTGVFITPAIGRNNKRFPTLPDSDIKVEGYQLPLWDQVLDLSLRASWKLYREAGKAFAGWDIAVTEDRPVLIEGNNAPSPNLAQRPLWVCRKTGIKNVIEPYL